MFMPIGREVGKKYTVNDCHPCPSNLVLKKNKDPGNTCYDLSSNTSQ